MVWESYPGGAIFSAPAQTWRLAHTASFTICTGSFPGVEQLGRGFSTHPHLVLRLKKE